MPSFAEFGNDLYTGRRSYDFVRRWRKLLTIAALVVVASIAVLGFRGVNPGIEFRGGSEFRVSGTATPQEQIATDTVTEVSPNSSPPAVSVVGGDSVRVQTEQLDDEQTTELAQALATAYGVDPGDVTSSFVGPSWGADVTERAVLGLVVFLVLVSVVISVYFRDIAMAGAALVALLHDLVLTAGVYALVGFEVTPASVIGFLTILGYSLYDTVVVFDKVREQTQDVLVVHTRTYLEAVNLAVNQTLVRSINTSVVAVLPVAAILFIGSFLLGAGTLRDVSLALFVGMLAGTYSSIFVAPAFLGAVKHRNPVVREHAERVAELRREDEERSTGLEGRGDPERDDLEPAGAGAGGSSPAGSSVVESTGQRVQPRRGGRGRPGGRRP